MHNRPRAVVLGTRCPWRQTAGKIRCRRHRGARQCTFFFRRRAPGPDETATRTTASQARADASATVSCRIAALSGPLYLLIDTCKEMLPWQRSLTFHAQGHLQQQRGNGGAIAPDPIYVRCIGRAAPLLDDRKRR
ncbi:hypothetical protein MRX96_014270 [Rhipicephalus microplus]